MKQEAKEIDGPDLEQAEERKRENELVDEKEDKLHDLDGRYETTMDVAHRDAVVDALRAVVAGERIVINDLALSKRHLIALEAVKTAVEGKDQELSQFVYAEDRRTLLEQALAILQPELATLDHYSTPFDDLMKQVGELRANLDILEDAEEELVEGRAHDVVKTETDTDDTDDTDGSVDVDGEGEGDALEVDDDTSLTGPERTIKKPPSSLGDAGDVEAGQQDKSQGRRT